MERRFGLTMILAKEQGFPMGEEQATELVAFLGADTSRERLEEISKAFAEIAYAS